MAKFNPNRVKPGTIELVRDSDGNYTTKVVGLETINSLSLPDISTTAATTKTDTDTKTATDITGDTLQSQTQMAFKTGDNNQTDTTGNMLKEAKKTSDMLSNTFTRPNMGDVANDRITSPLDIQSPTETVFDRPNIRDVAGDKRMSAEEAAPQENILSDVSLKDPSVTSANVQRGIVEAPGINFDFLKGDRFTQGTRSVNPVGGVDQIAKQATADRQEMVAGATPDDPTANTLGITTAKPADTALDTQRFERSTTGTLSDPAEKQDVKPEVKPEVKPSALKTVSTSLKSAFKNIKTPAMMLLDMVVGEPTAVQTHATKYFNAREDGRIAGNPVTDLYAGMNRVSAFGNLEKAGASRIETRERTIEKKGYGPGDKFYDDTQSMKDQQDSYSKSLDKNTSTKREAGSMNQPGRGGDQSGRSGGKIVCTMMNESYGFGSFRNKIWLRHSKNLAPEYQIGYHRIFLPLVKKAKTNKVIKKILEHIAIHRTIDIRQEEKNKIHLLGRIYRTILEAICYWVGKI